MRIVVIIPTYNEAENLPRMASEIFELPLNSEILIIDDNSPDGTGKIADGLAASHKERIRVMHRTGKFGISSAYLQAFRLLIRTDVDAIAHMDCDFSHDPHELVEMANCIGKCDVVFGSRYIPGGSTDVRWPIWRKGLSAWGNFYARTILGLPYHDVTGGYRMWRRDALQSLPLERVKSNGYVFTVEMAYLAYCMGLIVYETPIYFADRRLGKSKMSFKIQAEAAFRVWSILWNFRDLKHNAAKRK